jgi:DNA-binding CsgD family transcriptional regulator
MAARDYYDEIRTIARETDNKEILPLYLERLAEVVVAKRELVWAVRLFGAAETLGEPTGLHMSPLILASHERAIAAARAQLGEQAFTAAWAEGHTMTPEQALTARGPAKMTIEPSSAPPTKQLPTYPGGLTARELEVLHLVAQGLTDAQVAEQLVISPRTVNSHLTSIYSKLDVDSRTAASRFAIEQRLV